MPSISVVTPCYNEEANVQAVVTRVREVFKGLPGYDFEHILADNASTDKTLELLKELALQDKRIKVIANTRNFGPTKSVFNAILAASGDAVMVLAADLQDPPEMIPQFIEKWEQGSKIVFGIRAKRSESKFLSFLRKVYYRLLTAISEDPLMNDVGDYVLFDKEVLDVLKRIKDTNPYIRGLLTSMGYPMTGLEYAMESRAGGKSSTNVFKLMVYALNGLVNHTMFPLRMATFIGLSMAFLSMAMALVQLLLKLIFWNDPPAGLPTLAVGMFFLSGVQLFLLGFIGEIVGSLYRQTKNMPLVIERERINFHKQHHSQNPDSE